MAAVSTYVPYGVNLTAITLGYPTVATFGTAHAFSIGEIVSFRVSKQYGTVEMNNIQTKVLGIGNQTITVPIDSTWFTSFIPNPTNPQSVAMVVPSASGVVPGAFPAQTNLLDVFDNVPGAF